MNLITAVYHQHFDINSFKNNVFAHKNTCKWLRLRHLWEHISVKKCTKMLFVVQLTPIDRIYSIQCANCILNKILLIIYHFINLPKTNKSMTVMCGKHWNQLNAVHKRITRKEKMRKGAMDHSTANWIF